MQSTKMALGTLLLLALSMTTGCAMDAQDGSSDKVAVKADAEPLTSGVHTAVRNLSTQFCLDSNGSGHAYAGGCNGGNYQQWTAQFGTYGYKLIDLQTGRCLDSNAAGSVYTSNCNGGSYQEWTTTTISGCAPLTYPCTQKLQNVATGMFLDGNTSGSVYTHVGNSGNFQVWQEI